MQITTVEVQIPHPDLIYFYIMLGADEYEFGTQEDLSSKFLSGLSRCNLED